MLCLEKGLTLDRVWVRDRLERIGKFEIKNMGLKRFIEYRGGGVTDKDKRKKGELSGLVTDGSSLEEPNLPIHIHFNLISFIR